MFKAGVRKLLSFIAEGLILFDSNGSIALVNPHASLLLDYSAEELDGKHIDRAFRVYVGRSRLKKSESIFTTVFKKEKTFSTPKGRTIYFESQTGRRFPVFVSAKKLEIDGRQFGVIVFRDITTEKTLEGYKKKTAKRLAKLTPILQKTATGDFSGEIKIPKREDEFTELLVGLSLMLEDLREMEKGRARMQREKIKAVKYAEEEKRRLAESYSKELEEEVRKKTEEIRKASEHIETIIENLTSGLIEYDGDFTIVRMNRAAESMLGVRRDDVVGMRVRPSDIENKKLVSLVEVSYPALAKNAKKIGPSASGVAEEGVGVNEISIHYPLDRELQVITAPITSPTYGPQKGFIKVIRDITREKIISRSKSEFISIAAHQLRTPLSGIKWALRLVIDGDMGPVPEQQLRILKRGYDTNEKMIALVNDLLNVARIEDGRFGYDFKENDLVYVIDALVANSLVSARERDISLVFEKPVEPIPPFVFDASRLSLALQNLIDNAIKYTPPGGTVIIRAKRKDDNYAEISVSDTGVGIPEDQINRLFTKFFRARNVLRMQTAGSGLGLFIVKNIITRHGGEIHVQSKEGKGTTFYFTLPLNEELIPKEDVFMLGTV